MGVRNAPEYAVGTANSESPLVSEPWKDTPDPCRPNLIDPEMQATTLLDISPINPWRHSFLQGHLLGELCQ